MFYCLSLSGTTYAGKYRCMPGLDSYNAHRVTKSSQLGVCHGAQMCMGHPDKGCHFPNGFGQNFHKVNVKKDQAC